MLFDERIKQLRLQMNAVRRAIAELETQTEIVKERLGLQTEPKKQNDVVDVGPRSRVGVFQVLASVAKRSAQGVLLAVSFGLLGFALLSLGMFAGAAALAFLVITRGLGLRIDVPGSSARPGPASAV
ncbi:MAG: hypothetical protein Q8O67_00125 [Deltaproteobacteria bacterium]|nr:hypothetical protein [Deltaproteobacteria bacterium]